MVRVQLLRRLGRGRRGGGRGPRRRLVRRHPRPRVAAAAAADGRLVGARLVAEDGRLAARVLPEGLARILELDSGEFGVLEKQEGNGPIYVDLRRQKY